VIEVVHFQRLPGLRGFSIERLFDDLRAAMPADIRCRKQVASYPSRGVRPRLAAIREARRHAGTLNHITGDVHFLALGLPGDRTILTVHDCGILHRSRGLKRWVLRFFWFTWPLARCRVVTAISEATRRELLELAGASPAKVRVIHDCVSAEFVASPAAFNSTRPIILMLGTAPNKNLERMAAALAGLSCQVELIGRLSPAQKAVFDLHRVSVTELGDVGNAAIADAYRRCDLVLFASTHEGFGLPILEAQATGRPVVTGNCSSMPEVAGDAACLVDPLDHAAIRAGVERVIHDGDFRAQLLHRGLVNVQRFTAARIAGEYAALYREMAATAGAS
jgi:glycosyltransferase involved in cell wall biosynthesis